MYLRKIVVRRWRAARKSDAHPGMGTGFGPDSGAVQGRQVCIDSLG